MSLLTRLYLNSRKGFFRTLKKKRRFFHSLTFRRYPAVAKPPNCGLSAKIIFIREERNAIQEKPAIAYTAVIRRF